MPRLSHHLRNTAAVATLGLAAWASPAQAGGVGVMVTGGLHDAPSYYYRDDGQQGIDLQHPLNMGSGIEVLLGDKDDKVQGLIRLYPLIDEPVTNPDISKEDTANHTYTWPEPTKDLSTTGVLTMGIQWGVIGDPDSLELVANTLVGSGFVSPKDLQYLLVEAGAGATYRLTEHFEATATLAVDGRYRKALYWSENLYVGLRYLFD